MRTGMTQQVEETGRARWGEGEVLEDSKGVALRRLSRKALLEILVAQGKRLERLEGEAKDLRQKLAEAERALQSREIILDEAGSIAVAALRLNGIFEMAQAASQQYIENIQKLNDRQALICTQRDEESQASAERLLRETQEKCQEMEREAKERSEAYWHEVSQRLQLFYESHQELRELLDFLPVG